MRCPRPREVGRLSDDADWSAARRAYRALLGDDDPAAEVTRRPGALDLRPGGPAPSDAADAAAIVVSGPQDLRELREIVETVTGAGTWPRREAPTGEVRAARVPLERPAAALALLRAMEGLIEERSPWRTWPTAVETMAAAVAELDSLTAEAVVIESPTPRVDPDRPRRAAP